MTARFSWNQRRRAVIDRAYSSKFLKFSFQIPRNLFLWKPSSFVPHGSSGIFLQSDVPCGSILSPHKFWHGLPMLVVTD
jgi:hypothetical protein